MDLSINEGTLVVTAGAGDSFESAIVIKRVPKGLSAAGAEHILLEQRFGTQRESWSFVQAEMVRHRQRVYDVVHVTAGGRALRVYFDVTALLAG